MRIFITGITGTLGTALAELHTSRGDRVFGCCRSEARMVQWLSKHQDHGVPLLGDAIHLSERWGNLAILLSTVDRVYHCAAMKHVDQCEAHPQEAWRQNVLLTELVAAACQDRNVPLVFISSDKACLPRGVYGATKLLAERAALSHGAAVVRLVNIIGSSGSVVEKWVDQVDRGQKITLNDPEATRFFMLASEAAQFAVSRSYHATVSVPSNPKAVRMGDLANSIAGSQVVVGEPRPGDDRHQYLVAPGDEVRERPGAYLLKGPESPLEGTVVMAAGISSMHAERWHVGDLMSICRDTVLV